MNIQKIKALSLIGQNGSVGSAIIDIADNYDNLYVITADQEYVSGLKKFKEKFPNNYLNVGISEQNMVSLACSIALQNNVVVATAQAPFLTYRALDQVRLAMDCMKSNIILIGLSSGFSQGEYGYSHHCLNDIAIFNSFSNISILSPCDVLEAYKMIQYTIAHPNPTYIRLCATARMPIVHKDDYAFVYGKIEQIAKGQDLAIISTGSCVYSAIEAKEILKSKNINPSIYNVHTIKPFDYNGLINIFRSHENILVIEEHYKIGGLGQIISLYANECGIKSKIHHLCVDSIEEQQAPYKSLLNKYKIDALGVEQYISTVFVKGAI